MREQQQDKSEEVVARRSGRLFFLAHSGTTTKCIADRNSIIFIVRQAEAAYFAGISIKIQHGRRPLRRAANWSRNEEIGSSLPECGARFAKSSPRLACEAWLTPTV